MIAWLWVAVGTATLIGVSLVVGLALARILGSIADAASTLQEQERWGSAPLTRGIGPSVDDRPPRHARRQTIASRLPH